MGWGGSFAGLDIVKFSLNGLGLMIEMRWWRAGVCGLWFLEG